MLKHHSKQTKKKCLEKYLETGSIEKAAEFCEVPLNTVKSWHRLKNWKEKLEQNTHQIHTEVQNKVVALKVKEQFDARQRFIDKAKEAEEFSQALLGKDSEHLEQVKINPVHYIMLLNVLQKYYFAIAKIDGLITDKQQPEGVITIERAIVKILTYRRQGLPADDSYLRLLQGQKA